MRLQIAMFYFFTSPSHPIFFFFFFFPRPAPVCIAHLGSNLADPNMGATKPGASQRQLGLAGATPLLLAPSILSLCHGTGA